MNDERGRVRSDHSLQSNSNSSSNSIFEDHGGLGAIERTLPTLRSQKSSSSSDEFEFDCKLWSDRTLPLSSFILHHSFFRLCFCVLAFSAFLAFVSRPGAYPLNGRSPFPSTLVRMDSSRSRSLRPGLRRRGFIGHLSS